MKRRSSFGDSGVDVVVVVVVVVGGKRRRCPVGSVCSGAVFNIAEFELPAGADVVVVYAFPMLMILCPLRLLLLLLL